MGNESKLVVFGAGGVGKSAITVKFVQGKFVELYDPSICDKYRKQEVIDGETEIIEVVDTAGQEEYKPLRAQYYQKGEGFIAVYSITDRGSMGEVEKLRDDVLEERGCSWVPMVLVANKCDLEAQRKVTTSEGEALAKNWFGENRGIPFFETSAKDAINIADTFHQIVRELRMQKSKGGPGPAPVIPGSAAEQKPAGAQPSAAPVAAVAAPAPAPSNPTPTSPAPKEAPKKPAGKGAKPKPKGKEDKKKKKKKGGKCLVM
eukprot:TRINITY_DN8328_c0_g1_i1.p1 TRINITY_DN8328_c0_g1~~TRINITY_DN8328_c0_g1_i1.p1  ORF type:complete len:260 (+),score=41.33 TRINITY_DN8328_c0_g1_i1:64-843(+)